MADDLSNVSHVGPHFCLFRAALRARRARRAGHDRRVRAERESRITQRLDERQPHRGDDPRPRPRSFHHQHVRRDIDGRGLQLRGVPRERQRNGELRPDSRRRPRRLGHRHARRQGRRGELRERGAVERSGRLGVCGSPGAVLAQPSSGLLLLLRTRGHVCFGRGVQRVRLHGERRRHVHHHGQLRDRQRHRRDGRGRLPDPGVHADPVDGPERGRNRQPGRLKLHAEPGSGRVGVRNRLPDVRCGRGLQWLRLHRESGRHVHDQRRLRDRERHQRDGRGRPSCPRDHGPRDAEPKGARSRRPHQSQLHAEHDPGAMGVHAVHALRVGRRERRVRLRPRRRWHRVRQCRDRGLREHCRRGRAGCPRLSRPVRLPHVRRG